MSNIFSASEIVEMGINIEENGRDFYNEVLKMSKDEAARQVFRFLSAEEENHIKRFEAMLSKVKKYEPSEAYPGEYFAYIKSLSGEYVFTEKNKGTELAKKVKAEKEAIDIAIGFEKDSILFYDEMKKFVLEGEHGIVDKLIEEEKNHLRKLILLRS